jgi:hypothetical protein
MTDNDRDMGRPRPQNQPADEDIVGLYRRAFDQFGARALWNIKQFDQPTIEQVLAITRQLRTEGDMNARRLAEQIERAGRADLYSATIGLGADETRLEWVADSDYRFFPVIADDQFGYVLPVVDLAVNKIMAAASRREPRDIVDLVTLHDRVLPLGALVWAAVETAPGYTPEGLIAEIRRNARYPADELRQLAADPPVDPDAVMRRLRAALDEAEQFVATMPSDKAGLLFLQAGKPIQPDPTVLDTYSTHAPQRRGHWPSSPEITAAMLAHLQKPQL